MPSRFLTCPTTGKLCFTEPVAQYKAKKSAQITGEFWSSYLCPSCGNHHIGHTPLEGPRSVMRKAQKKRWRERKKGKR